MLGSVQSEENNTMRFRVHKLYQHQQMYSSLYDVF